MEFRRVLFRSLEGPDPGPGHGTGTVKLLFDEATSEEKTYFHRFGVFPIMHVLSLNRSVLKNVHDEREKLITQLTDAFDSSTARATAVLRSSEHCDSMIPAWMLDHRGGEQRGAVLHPYPVGLEANQIALGSLIRWMTDQGLIDAPFPMEQMFDRESRCGTICAFSNAGAYCFSILAASATSAPRCCYCLINLPNSSGVVPFGSTHIPIR